jgi:cold-inducible RNA-binding protein
LTSKRPKEAFPRDLKIALRESFVKINERVRNRAPKAFSDVGGAMSKKIYVGNLSYTVTEDQVKELFAPHGAVESVKFIRDKESGRFKGFGFVEMTNPDEAAKAVSTLHGTEYEGRKIVVSEAHERPEGGGNRGGPRGGGRGERDGNRY